MAEIWNYETIKELLYAPGLGHYFTYGLLAARKINAAWEPVEFIHDVTTDYLLVKKMEELFNRYQLYPIHLRDAIEDMLPYNFRMGILCREFDPVTKCGSEFGKIFPSIIV